jgi:hypothetical protein
VREWFALWKPSCNATRGWIDRGCGLCSAQGGNRAACVDTVLALTEAAGFSLVGVVAAPESYTRSLRGCSVAGHVMHLFLLRGQATSS